MFPYKRLGNEFLCWIGFKYKVVVFGEFKAIHFSPSMQDALEWKTCYDGYECIITVNGNRL